MRWKDAVKSSMFYMGPELAQEMADLYEEGREPWVGFGISSVVIVHCDYCGTRCT